MQLDRYGGPSTRDNTHQRRKTKAVAKRSILQMQLNLGEQRWFPFKREDHWALTAKKVPCHTWQRVMQIVKAAVTVCISCSTTLIKENSDLLVLLLYYYNINRRDLYFRSDKGNPTVYNVRDLKQLLGEDICTDLLLVHAFTGSDTTSRIFGVGKNQCYSTSSRVILSCMSVPRFSLIHWQTKLLWKVLSVKQWCYCLMGQSLTLWPQLRIVICAKKWRQQKHLLHQSTHAHTHDHFTALLEFVWDHPGEQVPER